MGDVTKIVDKCRRCKHALEEGEDIYCTACLEEEGADAAVEGGEPEEAKAQDEEQLVPAPLVGVYFDAEKGPYAVIDNERGITPVRALEMLLFVTEDLRMSLTAARVAQNIASMSRDKKTFDRLFHGAAKKFKH